MGNNMPSFITTTKLIVSSQVKAAKARGKVYSMVFVGINGVGKSTSLAKVAYYLKQNGIKVRHRNVQKCCLLRTLV